MTTALTHARIIDPDALTEMPGTVIISGQRIVDILPEGIPFSADTNIDCQQNCLAPGIIDIGVKVSEPGERQKESFATAGRAAAAGGVTTMVTRPDTAPPVDTPEALQFLHRRAVEDSIVRVLPMAALTKGRNGQEMTEIGFLMDAGAVAFSDADRPVRDPRVFSRALAYAAMMDALVIGHGQDPDLSDGAAMTSGVFATKLGLPAVSPIAERLQIDRDVTLAMAAGARFHIDQISTATGVAALAAHKAAHASSGASPGTSSGTSSPGRITAGVSVHHLTLNEFDIGDYRTFFKLKPPLRAEADRMAMVAALAEGVIDIISSMHTPQDEESKRLPFADAASGAVALETLLPACLRLVHDGQITLPALIRALTLNPARLLGLASGRMAIGAPADLILFNPDTPFQLDRHSLRSKSKNTPFDLARMQGRVLKTYVGGNLVFDYQAEQEGI